MGRIAASLFTTLDGSAERPDQWHFPYFDEAMGKVVDAHTARCEAYLMGRGLYDQWSQYWPSNTDPEEFGAFINPATKYVLSTTLERADWEGTTILRSLDDVRALKERTEGTIGMSGSLRTVASLLGAGLLDELELLVDPVVVSGERRWTDGVERAPLELVSSTALPTGVLHLVYRPAQG
ncbi:dihydrofolate reductase family protein [Vallicoccus soli]|uniref:Dihydrofolate reductase n=1 Tax=Vallicoccus soli TaxID=2339232 RepID=A0A3A3YTL9_9ACTN|nr:dihydrofolate reductase family protein [Vallicoccus soli]RJK94824.1 dihydrofolate reductase [Vallicoccus soli]